MKKVLVVDDEPRIVQLVRDYLEHAGFAVRDARDGAEAVRLARADRPDLVVLDLGLPRMDGIDVARTLRARGRETPIVLYSAYLDPAVEDEALALGLRTVDKGEPDRLMEALRAVLAPTA